jgi:hypothetical protein
VIQENSQSDEEKFVPEKLEAKSIPKKGPKGSEDGYDDKEAIEAVRVSNLELKNKEEEIEAVRVSNLELKNKEEEIEAVRVSNLETEKKRNQEALAAKEALQKQKEEDI